MATAIIYNPDTGIIRRIVTTDDPSSLSDHLGVGEGYLFVDDSVLVPHDLGQGLVPALDLAYRALKDATGIEPELYRCLVIEDGTGDVVGVICADATIDAVEGHTLWPDETGGAGYSPDESGNFVVPPEAE